LVVWSCPLFPPNMYPLLVSPTSHDFRTFPDSYFHSSSRQDCELS
jgi:hypothetical protein